LKIELFQIAKTTDSYLREGIDVYNKRLKNYLTFEIITLPELKNASSLSLEQQKNLEGKSILNKINSDTFLILLDENGRNFSSVEFSNYLQKQMLKGLKGIVFVIGGPYGFSQQVYDRANDKITLSKMTFSHQLVRLVFMEQLYRAMTILKNEPYHH
jgi:23S rRNA (pseudouridine1915-N3)-methyltransferase